MKLGQTGGPLSVSSESFKRTQRAVRKVALACARFGYRLAVADGDPVKIKRALNAVEQAKRLLRVDADRKE